MRRLPWLLAVPLMAAGSLAARGAGSVCLATASGETGDEAAERVHAFSWPLVLGIVVALVLVSLTAQSLSLVLRRPSRAIPAAAFLWLPPLAFLGQELAERLLNAEAGLGRAALVRVLLGLLLQVPFALIAFFVALTLHAVAARVVRELRRARPLLATCTAPLRLLDTRSERPPLTLLALGHPQRGPPINA